MTCRFFLERCFPSLCVVVASLFRGENLLTRDPFPRKHLFDFPPLVVRFHLGLFYTVTPWSVLSALFFAPVPYCSTNYVSGGPPFSGDRHLTTHDPLFSPRVQKSRPLRLYLLQNVISQALRSEILRPFFPFSRLPCFCESPLPPLGNVAGFTAPRSPPPNFPTFCSLSRGWTFFPFDSFLCLNFLLIFTTLPNLKSRTSPPSSRVPHSSGPFTVFRLDTFPDLPL